jgi:cystathionine beta-lyase
LTDTQHEYIPFASVSEICAKNSITCIAPTKAFNIAGLQTAAVVVPDEVLRHKMNKALNTDEVAEPNAIAMEATVAAFTKGEGWLSELRSYIEENRKVAGDFIESELRSLYLVPAHATYLLWVDCSRITQDATCLCQFLRSEAGLYVSAGESYGETGRCFIRINVACPRERLDDGLTRLKKGIELYKKIYKKEERGI